jgi:malate synthase
MSNTPRVDEELQRLNDAIRAGEECDDVAEAYAWEFARQLERELAERDKLIEQMRDALKALKQRHYVNDDDNWYSCPASGLCSNDSAGTDCNCGADYVNSIIEAALSAADGGEG